MRLLEPPDTHYLSGALGWIGLGKPAEAETELDSIRAEFQDNPDVLETRWICYAEQKRWDKALDTARRLIETTPERPSGWLHQAYATRRVAGGDVSQAWDLLLPAYERFPEEPTIPYNLSCYACQMRQLDTARAWLKRAVSAGGKQRIKEMALSDQDLQPLWEEIRQL